MASLAASSPAIKCRAYDAKMRVSFEYVDKTSIPPTCVCLLCKEAFIEPVETPCQHVFCNACLADPLRELGCPVCHAALPSAGVAMPPSTNEKLLHLLDDLVVHCANKERDCAWQGPRRNLTKHLASNECQAYAAESGFEGKHRTNAHIHGITSGAMESPSRPAASGPPLPASALMSEVCMLCVDTRADSGTTG